LQHLHQNLNTMLGLDAPPLIPAQELGNRSLADAISSLRRT
jgi:hypothetical protein